MHPDTPARRGMPLHTQILLGLLAGAGGVLASTLWRDAPALLWLVENVAQPVGQVFLRLLFMVVVPLVFTSLALIFFTLIFAIALTRIPRETAEPVLRVLEGVSQAVMVIIGFAMRLAPFGVAGLIFALTARFGFEVRTACWTWRARCPT